MTSIAKVGLGLVSDFWMLNLCEREIVKNLLNAMFSCSNLTIAAERCKCTFMFLEVLSSVLKIVLGALACVACEPKGCWFNSQSGHMPGLRARSPVGGKREATNPCFSHTSMLLSNVDVSVSFFLSPFSSL